MEKYHYASFEQQIKYEDELDTNAMINKFMFKFKPKNQKIKYFKS